jgi:hypothetical protein
VEDRGDLKWPNLHAFSGTIEPSAEREIATKTGRSVVWVNNRRLRESLNVPPAGFGFERRCFVCRGVAGNWEGAAFQRSQQSVQQSKIALVGGAHDKSTRRHLRGLSGSQPKQSITEVLLLPSLPKKNSSPYNIAS